MYFQNFLYALSLKKTNAVNAVLNHSGWVSRLLRGILQALSCLGHGSLLNLFPSPGFLWSECWCLLLASIPGLMSNHQCNGNKGCALGWHLAQCLRYRSGHGIPSQDTCVPVPALFLTQFPANVHLRGSRWWPKNLSLYHPQATSRLRSGFLALARPSLVCLEHLGKMNQQVKDLCLFQIKKT